MTTTTLPFHIDFLKAALPAPFAQFHHSDSASFSFLNIQTDSRSIKPDDLFVAIAGDVFDGHTFIESCLQKGVKGVICEKIPAHAPKNILFIEVPSTIEALRRLAKAWKNLFSIPVIAVAGSVGKTTTKELLASLLKGKYSSVLKTEKSQNGFLGIALTLLKLRKEHDCAVVEVGIDEPGAMVEHMDLIKPDFGVLTAIGEEHLEKLIDLKTVTFEEQLSLRTIAAHQGKVAIHCDDPNIKPLFLELPEGSFIGFTTDSNHPYLKKEKSKIVLGHVLSTSQTLKINWKSKSFEVPLPLPGHHNAQNLLAAISTALLVGLTPEEIKKGLPSFQSEAGRSELLKLKQGILCLNDSYNANPTSMRAAFKIMHELQTNSALHLCLGDMLELGKNELELHAGLYPDLNQFKNVFIYLYGPRMKSLQSKFRATTKKCVHFETHEALAEHVLKNIQSSDRILIKGSRGMKMEKVLEYLQKKL